MASYDEYHAEAIIAWGHGNCGSIALYSAIVQHPSSYHGAIFGYAPKVRD